MLSITTESPHDRLFRFFVLVCVLSMSFSGLSAQELELQLRNQHPISEGADRFYRETHNETWQPAQTAVIVCDMWDAHHCVNAVRRGAGFARALMRSCVQCVRAGRRSFMHRAVCESTLNTPHGSGPKLRRWSSPIPADIRKLVQSNPRRRRAATYPLDQSAGGEDDDPDEHRRWAQRLEASGQTRDHPGKRKRRRSPSIPSRTTLATVDLRSGAFSPSAEYPM